MTHHTRFMFYNLKKAPVGSPGLSLALFLFYRNGGNCFAGFNNSIWLVMCELENYAPQNPGEADLTIERFEPGSVVIHRVDRTGQLTGLTGTYSGTVKDGRIVGRVTYDWPNHTGYTKEAPWRALVNDPRAVVPEAYTDGKIPSSTPRYIVECEPHSECDAAWTFEGNSGLGFWRRKNAVRADLTIESFDPDNIVISRTDPPNATPTAIYKGKLKGNVIRGDVSYFFNGKEVGGGKFNAGIPPVSCKRTDGLVPNAIQAKEIAANAANFGLLAAAFECLRMSALSEDAEAENEIGLAYYTGAGTVVPQDYKQAFVWFSKSAAQHDYTGYKALGELYKKGLGVPQDTDKANELFSAANATPEGQQIAIRQFQVLNSVGVAVIGLGIMDGISHMDTYLSGEPCTVTQSHAHPSLCQ